MDKVINIENILAYKEAVKTLKELNIDFDKNKLLENPELCQEITRLIDYYHGMKR